MLKNQITIPPRIREEWKQIVLGEIEHKFHNFVLQLKVSEYKSKISSGEFTVDKAIKEMYGLCEKYALAVQIDLKEIFKEW